MSNIIEIKNVSKTYGNYKALDDISINVPRQSIYGLLGPNGAGKTTLITEEITMLSISVIKMKLVPQRG